MRVVAGTTNPSKLEGIRRAFKDVFGEVEIIGIKVSTPNAQPFGFEQILEGARVRAKEAYKITGGFDFAVGLEAGIITLGGISLDVQLAYILNSSGVESIGLSPGFPLPPTFIEKIKEGVFRELEEAADAYFGTIEIGQKGGVIKFLSKSRVTREDLSYYATLMALIPFENRELFLKGR